MSKNLKELEQEEEALARAVRSSAQQIWQAGLGAFAKAQAEGGREFTRLVRDGSELQKRARQVEDATDTVARKAERASRRASGSWGKLEQVFEERVARALATIGVPVRSELEALVHRVDALERMLAEVASERMAPASAPAVSRTPARPALARKRAAQASVEDEPAREPAAQQAAARTTAAVTKPAVKKAAATKPAVKKAAATKPAAKKTAARQAATGGRKGAKRGDAG